MNAGNCSNKNRCFYGFFIPIEFNGLVTEANSIKNYFYYILLKTCNSLTLSKLS